LLLIPFDNKKLINFLNFSDLGLNNLKETNAFKKVHTISKSNKNNLNVITHNYSTSYKKLNQLTLNSKTYQLANNYSFVRQHNLLPLASTGVPGKTFLDSKGLTKFLAVNTNKKTSDTVNLRWYAQTLNFHKPLNTQEISASATVGSILRKNFLSTAGILSNYPDSSNNLNTDSDKKLLLYPSRKLFNPSFLNFKTAIPNFGKVDEGVSVPGVKSFNPLQLYLNNSTNTPIIQTSQSTNQSALPADQNIRQYQDLTPNTHSFNYAMNPVNIDNDLYKSYNIAKAGWVNSQLVTTFLSNKVYIDTPHSPIFSSNTKVNSSSYDTSTTITDKLLPTKNTFTNTVEVNTSNNIFLLRGKRDGAPNFLNTTY
jgi:hypothetical protein